jgi:hypothetical protein
MTTKQERAPRGFLDALFAISLRETKDPETSSVALLRVRSLCHDPLEELRGRGADLLPPIEDARRCPFKMLSMGTRHVLFLR